MQALRCKDARCLGDSFDVEARGQVGVTRHARRAVVVLQIGAREPADRRGLRRRSSAALSCVAAVGDTERGVAGRLAGSGDGVGPGIVGADAGG